MLKGFCLYDVWIIMMLGAKRFVRDELDAGLLSDALRLGELGQQYCIKSEKAFMQIHREYHPIEKVDREIYLERYNECDLNARRSLFDLIDSDRNTLNDTFSKYI